MLSSTTLSPWPRRRRSPPFLTFFPAILVLASILSRSQSSEAFVREIFRAVGRILPEGTNTAVTEYFTGAKPVQTKFLVWISISYPVDGFRRHDLVDGRLS